MSEVSELHTKAMDLAELAYLARARGDFDRAAAYAQEALPFERQAAEMIPKVEAAEPTRSILYRSAASLAYQAREFQIAERLIAEGLAGYPPQHIREQLRELLSEVTFEGHLADQGIMLADDQFQVWLEGAGVGHGRALSEEFISRIRAVQRLVYRTVERRMNRPYRERGQARGGVKQFYSLFVSAPIAGSFSVVFELGRPTEKAKLFTDEDIFAVTPAEIIADVITDLTLLQEENVETLRSRFSNSDEAYLPNFVALARQIAPDGDEISRVAFSSASSGETAIVTLKKPRQELPNLRASAGEPDETGQRTSIEIRGTLLYANAIRNRDIVQLVDKEGKRHLIQVPRGLMADVVKPFFEEDVIIAGSTDGKTIFLEEIDLAGD